MLVQSLAFQHEKVWKSENLSTPLFPPFIGALRISHRILPKDALKLLYSASVKHILSNVRLFVTHYSQGPLLEFFVENCNRRAFYNPSV
jgi:hypothetical protein